MRYKKIICENCGKEEYKHHGPATCKGCVRKKQKEKLKIYQKNAKIKIQLTFLNDLIAGLQADKDGEQPIEDALTYLKKVKKILIEGTKE